MAHHAAFSEEAINNALETARAHNESLGITGGLEASSLIASSELSVRAECISVTVNKDGKICITIPKLGEHCLPIPKIFPSGTAAQACLDICSKFGFPVGVKITISVLGHVVITKTFGLC